MTDIRFDAAEVRFPSFTLGPVTANLEPGLTALTGPSGSGKSTLLGIAAGLRPVSRGQVVVDGMDLARISDETRSRLRMRSISVALQQPLFFPSRSLLQNLTDATTWKKRPGRREAMELLEAIGLADRAHHLPSACSGGELARAATARAFHPDCPVVILDEPTAMLDEASAARVRTLIEHEARARIVLAATHDPELIPKAQQEWKLEAGQFSFPGRNP